MKLAELDEVVAFLATYGQFDRLNEIALAVAPTPHTGNAAIYEPVREIIHTAAYFADRRVDATTLRALDPSVFVPADFTRPPGYLRGGQLRGMLEMPADEAVKYDVLPASYHAGRIATDLLVLASISVCGGSSTWTPERIDAQVKKNIAGVHAVPGYAPPTS
ncbi:hypothetical protein LQ938_12005 [Microbacterium sp. cx-55]|uniref:hypothetical protein n=1 Tax=Microbacterium sp. cx-55 TaxID=2875948 RepID=UPI001CBA8BFF|nr:hypothetical protein [Microbacterium sp. cx-55]MBZ4488006.1 hypothetical protein [Microbacterium sp. cx-55]UGB34588.1 hypothetical protein LQ938_12005 [Microbacterium sp. cx-55]